MSRKQVSITIFTVILSLTFFLTGCDLFEKELIEKGPEETYQEFWNACNSGDIATAESLATDDAKESSKDFGICLLTHDMMNRLIEGARPLQEYTDTSPEIEISGNTAYLKWTTTDGSVNTLIMYKVDGNWKVQASRLLGEP